MKSLRIFPLFLLVLMAGCAVGQKYDYRTSAYPLPISGSGPLQLAVVDERPYIKDGDKSPDFVGLLRGGFGNPFDVKTASRKPLAEDVAVSLERSLEKVGFDVEILADPANATAERGLVLRMLEWKTDMYMKINLHFDLELQVRDAEGNYLAQKRISGEEPIGMGKMSNSKNSEEATTALGTRIGGMFLDPAVAEALQ